MVVMMQRFEWFSEKMEFFLGTMGHIVAFGIKSLAFQIMNLHFSLTFTLAINYFFISLLVSILTIYGLSVIRKHFCFAIKEIHEQTAEIRQKISDKTDAVGAQISHTVNRSLSTIKSLHQSNDNLDIYESDIMDLFLNENDYGKIYM